MTETGKFPIRSYECQWQVVIQPIDQYGQNCGPETVLSRWATREEALNNRPQHGSEQNHRFVPFGGTGYENLNVVYREVPVETASPEIAALTAERDEADRRAGAAERRNADLQDGAFRRAQWLHKAKRERGYPTDVSFDTVWAETCRKADEAEAAREKIAALKIDPVSSEGNVWNTALDRAIAILSGTDETNEMGEEDEQGS